MRSSFVVLCIAILFCSVESSRFLRRRKLTSLPQKVQSEQVDAGEPLILTPLIQANKIQEAQDAARVQLVGAEDIEHYSGFLTVNKLFNSNIYFWFFKSRNNPSSDPVVLWLQGGPGMSSLFGLFAENGPFFVDVKSNLVLRDHAWTNNHSVLYIDNPVGTGYSFTNGGYADNQTQIGKELYEGLYQFFQLFPELQKNDFFITGESYAGKYIPAIAYTILKKNPHAELKINLQGLAIGDGLSDPITQLTQYSAYLSQIGFIDISQRNELEALEEAMVKAIEVESWGVANHMINQIDRFIRTSSGFDNFYNYLFPTDPTEVLENAYIQYITKIDIRRALHVGSLPFGDAESGLHLTLDMPKSVKPWVIELLSNYRVLIYQGQVDVIVGYPLTLNYLQHLEFSAAEEYKTAPRIPYYVGDDLAGYSKAAGNLTELLIRNAGHMVPYDQPVWANDMIIRFTRNKPFH